MSAPGLGIPSPTAARPATRVVKAVRIWIRTTEGESAAVTMASAATLAAPKQTLTIRDASDSPPAARSATLLAILGLLDSPSGGSYP